MQDKITKIQYEMLVHWKFLFFFWISQKTIWKHQFIKPSRNWQEIRENINQFTKKKHNYFSNVFLGQKPERCREKVSKNRKKRKKRIGV